MGDRLKKFKFGKSLTFFCIVFCIAEIALSILRLTTKNSVKAEIGVNAVKLLYEFRDLEGLESQQAALERITTEDVYNQLTIDNEQRLLNTYLKFNEDTVSVNVEDSTELYVIYSLKCESISPDRKFVFMFNVGSDGKICRVRECELIDFIAGD